MSVQFQPNGKEFEFYQLEEFIQEVKNTGVTTSSPLINKFNNDTKEIERYFNVPIAFDTETTSYILQRKNKTVKTGFMYIWMFGINGVCICGRKWEEFKILLKRLTEAFRLILGKKMIIYVHNLAFDAQFFRRIIPIDSIFINNTRTPLYFTSGAFEFRCSYLMTGESLATVGKNLVHYKMDKKVGDLDYDLCRHFRTPLTKLEMGYCFSDIKVQMCKLQELIEEGEEIPKLPLTSTGFVRRNVRKKVLSNKKLARFIRSLVLTMDEYKMWKECFQGGHTHGNILYANTICRDIESRDETSAYPTVMLSEQFPMSNGVQVELTTEKELLDRAKTHILIFYITLYNVKLKEDMPDAPIARSKCIGLPQDVVLDGYIFDNGKVRQGKEVTMVMTNVGYDTISKFYDFDSYKIGKCYQYQKGYLPKELFECILDYYEMKTTLKGVIGKEIEYLTGKKLLNAIFGMMVMDIIREIYEYDEDYYDEETGVYGWKPARKPKEEEAEEMLEKYNTSKKRFNWYPWGCMITEYARYNLLTAIYEMGMDFIYADTDSVKIFNADKHREYFDSYNNYVTYKLEKACIHHGIDPKRLRPKTIDIIDEETGEIIKKGEEKPLGVWDFDGHYSEFKFLHSKCYIGILDDDPRNDPKDLGLHCTIAGIPKKKAKAFLEKQEDIFETFDFEMTVPAEESGKLCHHYCDEEYTFEVTDYLGNTETVTSYGGVCLEKMPFMLKDMPTFEDLMIELQRGSGE